jgi:hypothetical protein
MRRCLIPLFTLALTVTAAGTVAEAASPRLTIISPRGVQRGTEATLRFTGSRLADAQEVLFYTPGVTAKEIKPVAKNANAVDVVVQVAADCRVGEHVAQLRCQSGITDYRTFYVGPFASVEEKEPNSEFETPQTVAMNVTVDGVVQSEDVDYNALTAKKGQRIAVEIEAMRLGTTMFDPYIAILDAKRFELAAADDSPLLHQDACATVVAPEDGTYVVEVRESAYGGNGNCRYRLHVGHFPRPTAVYPAGGKVGEQTQVTFLGDAAGPMPKTVTLPAEPAENFGLLPDQYGLTDPSENPFRLSPHGNVLEAEPNDAWNTATPAELPLAFNGIIEKDADQDYFKFTAKKGQVFEVECYARRLRSPLDPVMNLYQIVDGKSLKSIAGNDDSRGPDSYARFSVPADGEYAVRVTDHLQRGGATFVYRIEFQPISPGLDLGIPRVTRYGQERQTISVPRGGRVATLVTVTRRNVGGEVVFDGKGLPAGVTMVTRNVPSSLNQWPVVFEAAADAPVAGGLVDFTAHVAEKPEVAGGFKNNADLIIGNPGQSRYWTRDVGRLAMAVVDEVPFTLEIVQPKVPLVQNGSMELKVIAHKKEGWDEKITLEFPFRPPGIGTNPRVEIPKGKTEAVYPLNAAGNAAVGKWPVYVIGQGENGGESLVSSQMAELEVAQPFVTFAMDRSAVEQGQKTEIVATINHVQPFEGTATAKLVGLPNKVTVPELTFTKDTKELVFPVMTDPASPEGRHKNVFATVVVPMAGVEVVHRTVGGTELRIDKPLPKPVEKPKPQPTQTAKKEAPKPQPKPEKRLSRLEQLRLDAKKRAEGGGAE